MLAIIADDFTGAAEMAGIGLRYGLSVQVFTKGLKETDAELVILSTDSRSLNKAAALETTANAVKALMALRPLRIFKKTDSVLRGYVVAELKVQMALQGLEKVLLLPANPSLGRTISDGKYYVDGVLISETGFATDPEFAIKDASILQILGGEKDEAIRVLRNADPLPNAGIVAGEVSNKSDIAAWLERIDNTWLVAGAGDCFNALLQQHGLRQKTENEPGMLRPYLYVSGTSFAKSRAFIRMVQQQQGGVHYLPASIMQQQEDEHWHHAVTTTIALQQKAIIAIGETKSGLINITALQMRTAMAKAVKKIILEQDIKELLIEGGSTAAAIFEALGMAEFTPTNELARGVVRMKGANDLYVTVKPGSYALPEAIKDLYIS